MSWWLQIVRVNFDALKMEEAEIRSIYCYAFTRFQAYRTINSPPESE